MNVCISLPKNRTLTLPLSKSSALDFLQQKTHRPSSYLHVVSRKGDINLVNKNLVDQDPDFLIPSDRQIIEVIDCTRKDKQDNPTERLAIIPLRGSPSLRLSRLPRTRVEGKESVWRIG